jgi:3-methyladenine DNA glycosylase AlkD
MNSQDLIRLKEALKKASSLNTASSVRRFFKSDAEGAPQLLGVYVPQIREIARSALAIEIDVSLELLHSPVHEERLLALLIWVLRYPKLSESEKEELVDLYLSQLDWVNQWDLIDISAPYLLGKTLPLLAQLDVKNRDSERLLQARALIHSNDWFRRRVPLVASLSLVRKGELDIAMEFCTSLAFDSHDLLQKAVGWVLREVGKKDLERLKAFLDLHAHLLPRTTLRYSLERMLPQEKIHYMDFKRK